MEQCVQVQSLIGLDRLVQHTGCDDDRTPGTVFDLTDAELAMADGYEPAGYRRVAVRFASGREGWVYTEAQITR